MIGWHKIPTYEGFYWVRFNTALGWRTMIVELRADPFGELRVGVIGMAPGFEVRYYDYCDNALWHGPIAPPVPPDAQFGPTSPPRPEKTREGA